VGEAAKGGGWVGGVEMVGEWRYADGDLEGMANRAFHCSMILLANHRIPYHNKVLEGYGEEVGIYRKGGKTNCDTFGNKSGKVL
jgi:hypothetical protein